VKGPKNHLPVRIFFSVRFHGKKRFQFYFTGINALDLLSFMWLYSQEKKKKKTTNQVKIMTHPINTAKQLKTF